MNQFLGEISSTSKKSYAENISKDLLNKLSFSAYSNDLLFRIQEAKINQHHYTKDRGYSFEEHLNENTEGVMNINLEEAMPFMKILTAMETSTNWTLFTWETQTPYLMVVLVQL